VLENGLTLHHTYGTPIIPGSAIKGMTAHYCDNVLGLTNKEFLRSYEVERDGDVKDQKRGLYYQMLFGTNDNAGLICFHDALITPDWVHNGRSLLLDVITTHHPKYYSDSSDSPIEPTDTEDPIPIHFLSVQGEFRIVLEVDEDSADALKWRDFTLDIVKAALGDLGVGGKTSSGYGRLK
jgi:CRISPR-associated protein Cmr6